MSNFAERRWTSRDGLTLYARDYAGSSGSPALPVVCLHGLTRNSSDFEDVAPFIAGLGRRVIAPDVRGRGQSGWDPDPRNYVPRTYARDVLELLDRLGVGRAIFVGTSMGGIITMMLAARHRRRIAAAVLNDVGPEVAAEGIARIQSYAGKPVTLASWADAVAYARAINEPALPHLTDEDWERFAERTFARDGDRPVLRYDPAITAQLNAGKAKASSAIAWLLFRRLARRRPILILRGETSDILSRRTAHRMQAVAPTVKLAEIPAVGHAPMLDEPAARAALESFFGTSP